MSRSFDVVIFGASGFTGQFVVQEFAKQNTQNLRWAVAGRNREKLESVLQVASKELGEDYSGTEVIIADLKDEESLNNMCSQARMVLNCVGPYLIFGEAVVKACVENGCHHLDVSGEPEFLETMQWKYDEKARASKIFVVGSCGYDSIPADMGVIYTQKNFPGQLCHVESFMTINAGKKGLIHLHYGTYQTVICGIASVKEGNLKRLRKQLFPSPVPRVGPKLKLRGSIFYGKEVDKWSMLFSGPDSSVYPKIFSLGTVSHEGPTKKQIQDTSVTMTFYAKGYSDDYEGEINDVSKMDKKIVTRVLAPEPGYVTTPICMVQAALVILSERESMPESGGVLTPGAAFAETTLIERLDKAGVHFVVVEQPKPIAN